MKKKTLLIIIAIAVFVFTAAYLFAAHHYIYKKISAVRLPASDAIGEYVVSGGATSGRNLAYTALGDSLTAGVGTAKYEDSYPWLLAQKITGAADNVILRDRAYPGAKTSDLIRDLLSPAINDKPDVITILIGVNDIHGNVSKAQFTRNYEDIIKRLTAETGAGIYAISIPYIGTDELLLPPYDAYFRYKTIEYNEVIKKLAEAYKIKYIDLYTPTERMFEDTALCSADLFHPSARGYGLWADIIYANLDQ